MSASGSGDGHPAMAPPGIDSDGEMPGLIVFDLDYTLWPCWVDTHVDPPFEQQARRASESGDGDRPAAVDANGTLMSTYDDVVDILEWASGKSKLAAASRTHAPPAAVELMACLEIDHFFTFSEIYPSSKPKHFRALKANSGLDYADMIFFDDENRNIREVGKLGVTCVHVPHGLNWELFRQGLATWREDNTWTADDA